MGLLSGLDSGLHKGLRMGQNQGEEPGLYIGLYNEAAIYGRLEPETITWILALSTRPSPAVIKTINAFIRQCKIDGNWSKFDRLWVFAQDNRTNSKKSIINPSSVDCSEVNSPTWAAYRGFTGGSSAYLNTNYNTSTNAVNYTLNSAGLTVYARSNLDENTCIIGNTNGSSFSQIFPKLSNQYYAIINASGSQNAFALTTSVGLYTTIRTTTTSVTTYYNGVSSSTTSQTNTGVISAPLGILSRLDVSQTAAFSSNNSVGLAIAHSGTVDAVKLYAAVNTLRLSLGF